jgi:hypothetical protein
MNLTVFVQGPGQGLKWNRFNWSQCGSPAKIRSILWQPQSLFAGRDPEVHRAVGQARQRFGRQCPRSLTIEYSWHHARQREQENRDSMLHRNYLLRLKLA